MTISKIKSEVASLQICNIIGYHEKTEHIIHSFKQIHYLKDKLAKLTQKEKNAEEAGKLKELTYFYTGDPGSIPCTTCIS